MKKIVVPGRFASLNDFIDANRRTHGRWNAGNIMKQKDQKYICSCIPKGLRFKRIYIRYMYFEPNTKRDKDNISGYFHKVFQDALVQAGCIQSDGWKVIQGFSDHFDIDAKYPRIEILIEEI